MLAAVLLQLGVEAAPVEGKPNVLLIMSDYMGYRDIEPYGADDVRTPELSRLASEGVKMSNFYSASPVCGPARAVPRRACRPSGERPPGSAGRHYFDLTIPGAFTIICTVQAGTR